MREPHWLWRMEASSSNTPGGVLDAAHCTQDRLEEWRVDALRVRSVPAASCPAIASGKSKTGCTCGQVVGMAVCYACGLDCGCDKEFVAGS